MGRGSVLRQGTTAVAEEWQRVFFCNQHTEWTLKKSMNLSFMHANILKICLPLPSLNVAMAGGNRAPSPLSGRNLSADF